MTQLASLGKYHILQKLAVDEVAEIYKVKTLGIAGFEKVQVLKRILPAFGRDPEFIRAFIDEAKIAFSLNHRNIVQVFEFGKAEGDLFLAMEYIPGMSLQRIMTHCRLEKKTIPIGLACYLMGEVAAGLEYAHRKSDHFGHQLNIVHCNICPTTIACSFEGSVKILDFGLARAEWAMLPRETRLRRDVHYLSPEQLQGEAVDVRADLFSFGIILWELLSGVSLFEASTPEALEDNVHRAPIPPPRSLNSDVPQQLSALTMRCLSRAPEQRIASASDLQMELHRVQRMMGAVIGSRALSTYLESLFPHHGDARDVRQDGSIEIGAPMVDPATSVPDDLLTAAEELALPPNPPRLPLVEDTADTSPLARRATAGRPRREQTRTPRPSRFGGVIHASSYPEEIPGAGGLAPPLESTASDEFSAGAVLRRELTDEAPRPALTALEMPEHTEPSSPGRLLEDQEEAPWPEDGAPEELGREEPGARSTAAHPLDEEDDPDGRPEPTDASTPRAKHRRQTDASLLDDEPLQPALGEKKRFICVTILLEGATESREEAAALIADIAFKLDGILHERSVDKLVILFGLPTADENDLVAAVHLGLDAREAISRLTVPPPPEVSQTAPVAPVTLRIGIRTGMARLGDLPAEGYQVPGNTLAETDALAAHATPAQILLAGAASHLAAAHFVLRQADPLRRHGMNIRCHRLVGPRTQARRRRAIPHGPFIGREVELRAIRNTWREAVLQTAQRTVLIAGEPGLGKSRLVDEFLKHHASDARAIATAAMPHRSGTPYSLLVDLLRAITGVASASGAQARARLLGELRALCPEEEEQSLATFESLLSPHQGPVPDAGEGFGRRRILRAMRNVLRRVAASRPAVVVLENLHWADSGSFECIKALVEHPEEVLAPLLFLLTHRPEEEIPPANIFEHDTVSFILLAELDERDRQRLIIEELGERATPTLVQEVERRAGGNPFYIREITRAISEMKATGPSDVPATVLGVLAARVDRLPPPVKLVLQYAAVIGPTFREAALTRLAGQNPARSLALLRNRGIIAPCLRSVSPSAKAPGLSEQFEREWAFRHVLVQEVVYEAISPTARRQLHERVAEIMVRRLKRGSSDPPAEVARHLELCGQRVPAGELYLRAANEAAAAFASREALALYNHAFTLGDDSLHYAIFAGRERVYAQLGRHQEQAADLEALRRLSGDDPSRLADLRNREALRLLRLGEFYRALAASEEAEAAATLSGDNLARGESLRLRAEAYERLNDHPRAIDAVGRALTIFEEEDALPAQVRARIGLGRISMAQARYDEAFGHYEPALELIERTGDKWQERVLRNNLAVVHYCRGDFSRAFDEANHSFKLCEQFGDRAREGDNATVLGMVFLSLGIHDLARRNLEEGLGIHLETGSQWSAAETMVHLGILEASVRSFDRALKLLERAKEVADRIGAKFIALGARHSLAWALCERQQGNDVTRALDESSQAAEMAREAHLVVAEIPALSRAARATALLGDLEAARALSRRAVELLAEQRIIVSAEEEILYTHFRVLAAIQDPGAAAWLEQAHTVFLAKLVGLKRADWREGFEAVQLNAAIRRDFRRLGGG